MRPSGGCWREIAALLGAGDVITIDGKALRGARDKGQSARTRMMVSAYATRLRLTLATVATVAADQGRELEAAIEVLARAHWGIENALHWQLDVSLARTPRATARITVPPTSPAETHPGGRSRSN